MSDKSAPILVTGATGYVGGRLIPILRDRGYRVRAMGRSLDKLAARPWAGDARVELVQGDVLDRESLAQAAAGCRSVYYLVHSMIAQKDKFVEADRQAARNMVAAAAAAGTERIIYLGGLAETRSGSLSKHLSSRIEVAEILQSGPVPATDLRAPMILGSGSASFEILRYLVERLPVMTTPRWVNSLNQPIAVRNVLTYLAGCLEHPETAGQTYDIGGPDILTYRELLAIYAEEAGLRRRWIIPVPVLTPTLSAYWIHLVSPVPAAIALPLTEGLTSDAVCSENRIRTIIPQKLLSCREAIRSALDGLNRQQTGSDWKNAGPSVPPEWAYCGDADWTGGTIMQAGFRVRLECAPEDIWPWISRIGGANGWYFAQPLWRLRGGLDRLIGGIGLSRGRPHPSRLNPGDALDFWRVVEVEPPHRLLLLSEMKAPGEALLEFSIVPAADGLSELRLVSRFLPRGLIGLVYWYVFFPLHAWIFGGMLGAVARRTGRRVPSAPARFDPPQADACALPEGKSS
jgi:uncharacterized protein YbjT (DUF2867 family)